MKLLIVGARGLLGQALLEHFVPRQTVSGLDLPELDITHGDAVRAALAAVRPAVVINAAAYTKVDAAETERELAWRVNAEGPRLLAEACARQGIFLVHLSTDYVFDGRRPPPEVYVETDTPNPLSWYGETKRAGERAVAESGARYAILRTAWLFGAHGHHFLRAIARRAAVADAPIRIVNDQWGTPTWTARLAAQIERVLQEGAEGVFHATAEGRTTWYAFAARFAMLAGRPWPLQPCTTSEYPTPARRPANAVLENARLKAAGLNVFREWEEDLAAFIRLQGDTL